MAAPQGKGGDAAQPERKKKESILGIIVPDTQITRVISRSVVEPEPPFLAGARAGAVKKEAAPAPAFSSDLYLKKRNT